MGLKCGFQTRRLLMSPSCGQKMSREEFMDSSLKKVCLALPLPKRITSGRCGLAPPASWCLIMSKSRKRIYYQEKVVWVPLLCAWIQPGTESPGVQLVQQWIVMSPPENMQPKGFNLENLSL